jgi:tRNA(adenine34) deaminase
MEHFNRHEMRMQHTDEYFIRVALAEARQGDAPYGAVIVRDGEVLAAAHNLTSTKDDPTAHAEMVALGLALNKHGSAALRGATLYCSCEPCVMCMGAILWCSLGRLVFAGKLPSWREDGVVLASSEVAERTGLAEIVIKGGVLADEAARLISGEDPMPPTSRRLERARATVNEAAALVRSQNWQETVDCLDPLVTQSPDTALPSSFRLLSRAYLAQGLFADADAVIAHGYACHPDDEELRAHAAALQHAAGLDWNSQSTMRIVQYTRHKGDISSGHRFPAGYHSTVIGDNSIRGLREPEERLRYMPIDFAGKTVLDIGCNQGGFLFALADKIKWGVGLDYDPHMINACHKLRAYQSAANLHFFVYDFEKEGHSLIPQFMPEPRVDVAFLLLVWRDNLGAVLRQLASIADSIVFEPIESHPNAMADIEVLRDLYDHVEKIETDIHEPVQECRHTLYHATNHR